MLSNPHKQTALQYAVYLLSRRDHSERELRQKLVQKAYESEEIEHAVAKVKENRWQDDARFCSLFIRQRARQGYGPLRIQQELRFRGVADWLVTQQFDEVELDWFELAEAVFDKKRPREWDLKAKQKIWRYMLSHGFESDHFSHLIGLDIDE